MRLSVVSNGLESESRTDRWGCWSLHRFRRCTSPSSDRRAHSICGNADVGALCRSRQVAGTCRLARYSQPIQRRRFLSDGRRGSARSLVSLRHYWASPPTRQLPRRRSDPKITSRGRCVASRCRTWSACAGRGMRWQRSRRAQPLPTFLTGGRYFQSFSASGTKSMGSALIFSLAAIDTCDCQCAGLNIRSMWQRPAASCSSNSCVDTGNYDRSRVRPW